MGTSKTPAEFSQKLARMSEGVAKIPQDVARPNAETVKRVIGGAVNTMSGGDNRLSRAGPVGVNAEVQGGKVAVSPRGPVHLVENPTEAHTIGEGKRLRIGSDWVTGPVPHPGTRGKGQWKRAKEGLPDPVRATTTDAMTSTMGRVFG